MTEEKEEKEKVYIKVDRSQYLVNMLVDIKNEITRLNNDFIDFKNEIKRYLK